MEVDAENIIIGAGTEYLYSIIVQLLGRDSVIAVEDRAIEKLEKFMKVMEWNVYIYQ